MKILLKRLQANSINSNFPKNKLSMYSSSDEFRKFATKHMGISSSSLDKYSSIFLIFL